MMDDWAVGFYSLASPVTCTVAQTAPHSLVYLHIVESSLPCLFLPFASPVAIWSAASQSFLIPFCLFRSLTRDPLLWKEKGRPSHSFKHSL